MKALVKFNDSFSARKDDKKDHGIVGICVGCRFSLDCGTRFIFCRKKNHLLVLYKLDLLYLNTSLLRVSMHLFLPILDVCSVSVKIL